MIIASLYMPQIPMIDFTLTELNMITSSFLCATLTSYVVLVSVMFTSVRANPSACQTHPQIPLVQC